MGRAERSSTATKAHLHCGDSAPEAQALQYQVVKIAIDMHSKLWVAARQVDNATPQPPQKFTPQQCLKFIARQLDLAPKVVCCYEAGCFGYAPQRQIEALGAQCLVIAPQNWDERNKRVRTDRTDTMAMLTRLDRYVAGNRKALAVVRVPSLAQEVARSRVREREQLMSDRNRCANRGRSLLMQYGLEATWSWWKPDRWKKTRELVAGQLPQHAPQLLKILDDHYQAVWAASQKLEELTLEQQKRQKQRQKQKQPTDVPRLHGIGELSLSRIEAEIGDWNRFANRRQVASYSGLCPGVSGTGGVFTNLSVNKCGNRRLRTVLMELAWLLVRFQPRYFPLQRWKAVLSGTNRSAKKKAIVALARRLVVDLWRIATGRSSPQKLGLQLAA